MAISPRNLGALAAAPSGHPSHEKTAALEKKDFYKPEFYLSALRTLENTGSLGRYLNRPDVAKLWLHAHWYRDRKGAAVIAKALPAKGYDFWRDAFQTFIQGAEKRPPELRPLEEEMSKKGSLDNPYFSSFIMCVLTIYPARLLGRSSNKLLRKAGNGLAYFLGAATRMTALKAPSKDPAKWKLLTDPSLQSGQRYQHYLETCADEWSACRYRLAAHDTRLWKKLLKTTEKAAPRPNSESAALWNIKVDSIGIAYWSGASVRIDGRGRVVLWGDLDTGLRANGPGFIIADEGRNVTLERALTAVRVRKQVRSILKGNLP
ncbi:MAG: hypothetical protein P8018_13550 [Acidobacteriota bacterium]